MWQAATAKVEEWELKKGQAPASSSGDEVLVLSVLTGLILDRPRVRGARNALVVLGVCCKVHQICAVFHTIHFIQCYLKLLSRGYSTDYAVHGSAGRHWSNTVIYKSSTLHQFYSS